MSSNPLFPPSQDQSSTDEADAAVALIRSKVARAFGDEPDASAELAEAQVQQTPSIHQQYMQELGASGKSLAEIQTAWHHYYTTLSDEQKHEVWQEFYAANQHTPYQKLFQAKQPAPSEQTVSAPAAVSPLLPTDNRAVVADHSAQLQPTPTRPSTTTQQLKRKLADKVSANGKLTVKHHLQSLGFGLAFGSIFLFVILFTFFNEYIIAPFIQPSRNVSSTPIILSSNTASADTPPSVTVPKINIQIPVNFAVSSYDETVIENGLKGGVVHYPSTVLPGQNGNAAYFGHSSGNIFNNGKYKFAFTLLHDLSPGDLFYINNGGKTYAYRIFDRQIVPPSDVAVINDTKGKQATAELITCDPPGISTNRLVVWGEQISPSPSTNSASTQPAVTTTPTELSSNGPSTWSKFVNWVEFWN